MFFSGTGLGTEDQVQTAICEEDHISSFCNSVMKLVFSNNSQSSTHVTQLSTNQRTVTFGHSRPIWVQKSIRVNHLTKNKYKLCNIFFISLTNLIFFRSQGKLKLSATRIAPIQIIGIKLKIEIDESNNFWKLRNKTLLNLKGFYSNLDIVNLSYLQK